MPNTALHQALGIRNRQLELSDIQQVVELKVRESETLDWKMKLPAVTQHPNQATRGKEFTPDREFAKDVAAMANSAGGTIVFGIEEDGKTSAAKAVHGVSDWSDETHRKLRSWAASNIQPPIYDLTIEAIGTGDDTIVIVHVPASPQAPHFVSYNEFTHRVPRRTGTKTAFMSEREIAAAYRARFRNQEDRQKALVEMWEMAGRVVLGKDVTVVAVARPVHGRQPHLGQVTRAEVQEILRQATERNRFLVADLEGSPFLSPTAKRGLRLWRHELEGMFNPAAMAEVHDSGTLLLAWQVITPGDLKAGEDIDEYTVHQAPAYFAQLIEAAADVLGLFGDFEVKLGLTSSHQNMWIRQVEDGEFVRRSLLTPINGDFEPVDTIFTVSDDPEVLVEQVHNLALDLLNSGGITRVRPDVLRALAEG